MTLEETINSELGIVYVGNSMTCPPCRQFKQNQERIETELNNKIFVIDIAYGGYDDLDKLREVVNIKTSIPQFYVFKRGVVAKEMQGFGNSQIFINNIKSA